MNIARQNHNRYRDSRARCDRLFQSVADRSFLRPRKSFPWDICEVDDSEESALNRRLVDVFSDDAPSGTAPVLTQHHFTTWRTEIAKKYVKMD